MNKLILAILALSLVGCGSGGGGNSGGSNPPPPPPPPTPVKIVRHFAGQVSSANGPFANESLTNLEWQYTDNRLVIETVTYGDITVYPGPETQTGYHTTTALGSTVYDVWFWPQQNSLIISSGNVGVSWTIVEIAGNG